MQHFSGSLPSVFRTLNSNIAGGEKILFIRWLHLRESIVFEGKKNLLCWTGRQDDTPLPFYPQLQNNQQKTCSKASLLRQEQEFLSLELGMWGEEVWWRDPGRRKAWNCDTISPGGNQNVSRGIQFMKVVWADSQLQFTKDLGYSMQWNSGGMHWYRSK